MKGYLNNESATKNTIDDDGWLHTGDIGHIDADGHLFVVDRLKELIKYKGFQVAARRARGAAAHAPPDRRCCCDRTTGRRSGRAPRGVRRAQAGARRTAADIQGFVTEQVASYKQVRKLTFVDAIPKSASGKILRARPPRRSQAVSAALRSRCGTVRT